MARKFHNLAGWLRDVRAALAEGDELAYELGEVLIDVDDLVDPDVSTSAAGVGEDELLDADSSEGVGEETQLPGGGIEDVDADRTRMVRVGHGGQRRSDRVLASPGGAGGERPDGRATVLARLTKRAAKRVIGG